MNTVVEWLESPPGWKWARVHFSDDASDCHDMIEIINDYSACVASGHLSRSSEVMLEYLKVDEPIWADLTWTPDQPPDRVLPMRPV